MIAEADTLRSMDKTILAGMVQFIQPRTEDFKMRFSRSSFSIDYPLAKTYIFPGHGNNAAELHKIDLLVRSILTDTLVTVDAVYVTGYSSPDGSYTLNETLSRRRSEGFREYLKTNYPLKNIPVHIGWIAEDWDGFGRLVEASGNIMGKQGVLDIIHDPNMHPDTKDARLRQVPGNYRIILQELYPQLRRTELRFDYVARPLNDREARALLYSRPELLSLEEMMRVSSFYEPGSKQYREVFEIAAKHFPGNAVANNNAAAAALMDGDARAAEFYLQKQETAGDERLLVNHGVLSYITGDAVKAGEYFMEAHRNGASKGYSNLRLIDEMNNRPAVARPDKDNKSEGYRVAVKSNLLYDLALVPNLAMEFPLGRRWSMEIEGQWVWWNTKITHDYCWRIQSVGLEARRWVGGRSHALNGHYLGVYGLAGTYDVKFHNKNGYLSNMSYSSGISYGYSFPVSRRFNFELGIAAGYFGGRYKVYGQYEPETASFPVKEVKDMHYFGPTKAKISLVWIIGGGKN
jgi:hypothetical protein